MQRYKRKLHTALSLVLGISVFAQSFIAIITPQTAYAQNASASAFAGLGSIAGAGVGCLLGNAFSGTGLFSSADGNTTAGMEVPTGDKGTRGNTSAQKQKENCLDAIAYAAAKALLKKFTQATIVWINSGFKGEPLYIKNPESFFKSIANEQLGGIISTLSNTDKVPFGKDLARSIILSTQATFAKKIEYNLNKIISPDRVYRFQADFSAGGWDGWLGATQFPQNNTIGAHIVTADEVTYKLSGTAKAPAEYLQDELSQGMGFLGLKKCVQTSDGKTAADYNYEESTGESIEDIDPKKITCTRWETITPGTAIANQMNLTLGTSQRQLELADELNESIAGVFDALFSQLLNKGLASLGNSSSSSGYNVGIYGGYGNNSNNSSLNSNGNPYGVEDPDQWYNQNPTFNIWHDLQTIIDVQQKVYDDLQKENSALQNLTTAIYELDFCVPGPNPLWYDNAQQTVNDFFGDIPQKADDLGDKLRKANKWFDPGGMVMASTGWANELGLNPPGSNGWSQQRIQELYAKFLKQAINFSGEDDETMTSEHISSLGSIVLEQYASKISSKYGVSGLHQAGEYMPTVAASLPKLYNNIPRYLNQIDTNNTKMDDFEGIIRQLQSISVAVKDIPEDPDNQTSADKTAITTYLRIIGSMAQYMASESVIQTLEDELFAINGIYDMVANGNNSLINQCKTELRTTSPTGIDSSNIKGLRFAYPTDLLPQSIQDAYTGNLGGYMTHQMYKFGTSYLPGTFYKSNVKQTSWQWPSLDSLTHQYDMRSYFTPSFSQKSALYDQRAGKYNPDIPGLWAWCTAEGFQYTTVVNNAVQATNLGIQLGQSYTFTIPAPSNNSGFGTTPALCNPSLPDNNGTVIKNDPNISDFTLNRALDFIDVTSSGLQVNRPDQTNLAGFESFLGIY